VRGGAVITVASAAGFPTAGEFRIGGQVCTYTATTATAILGVRLRLHWWHRFLWWLGFRPLTTEPRT
jgi:hypothetical protein